MIEGIIPLLKLSLGLATAGLSLTIIKDLKGFNVIRRVKNVNMLPLSDEHISVLGATRHGKTYATLHTLKRVKKGVFFFNFQQEKVPGGFTTCDGKDSALQMKELVESGGKINFIPARDRMLASKQLKAIIDLFLGDGKEHNMYMVVDEVHLYDKVGIGACMQVATAGARWGVYGIFITQRPANMDNNLLGQSSKVISFNLKENDREYLRRYGYPVEDMMNRIKNKKYYFVVYDGLRVEGAFKLS
jgi:hypothetical protein